MVFYIRWTPHPVIVTIGNNRDDIRVPLYSYYASITGWGGSPKLYRVYAAYVSYSQYFST